MLRKLRRGATARVIPFYAVDKSQSPPGPYVGLTSATPGLAARYLRPGDATSTAIPLVAGTAGAWSAGGLVAAPGVPGMYLLGLPDAALASGDWVAVTLQGADSLHCPPILIELDAVDYQDAAAAGLSRLDAAVSTRLAPATAGRTLLVAASGHAGIDWAAVANPATAVALVNTTVQSTAEIDFPPNFDLLQVDAQGRVVSSTVADKAGYSLASVQSFSTTGAVGTVADKAGYSLASSQSFSTTGSVGAVLGSVASVAAGVTVGGYAAGQDPATRLFTTPSRKLDVAADGSVSSRVADKTGFVLAAAGLDMISVVDPGSPVNWTTMPKMVAGLAGHATRKRTLAGGWLRFYLADGVTVAYAQASTDDGTTQTLGAATAPV